MNILIVGAAGYLGTKLTKRFLDNGYKVNCIDNLYYKQGPYIADTFLHPACKFELADCMDSTTEKYIRNADHIYWLVALVGGPACDKDRELAQRINVDSVAWLLKKLSPNQRVTFLCSSSGYGCANTVCTEETKMQSISFYGLSKEIGENIIMQHPNTTSLRLATVWGFSPRMRLDLIVNDLLFKAHKHHKLDLYQGDYMRAYVHIDDVVDTLYLFNYDSRVDGQIYNLAGDNCTKSDLIMYIKSVLGEIDVQYSDQTDYDNRSYFLDCSKLKKLKSYSIKRSLMNNLKDLIPYYNMISLDDAKVMRNI